MTFYTRSGLPLNFKESPKAWNNSQAICNRKPIDIAIDGQGVCYKCGHHLDEHSSSNKRPCGVCVALSEGIHSPDKMASFGRRVGLANQRNPLI